MGNLSTRHRFAAVDGEQGDQFFKARLIEDDRFALADKLEYAKQAKRIGRYGHADSERIRRRQVRASSRLIDSGQATPQ